LVKKIKDELALVIIDRPDFRSKCLSCKIFPGEMDQDDAGFWARNRAAAKAGDKVVVQIPERRFVITVLIFYALPLLAILAGAGLGKWIERQQNFFEQLKRVIGNTAFLLLTQNVPSLILGAAFLALCFGFIWIGNRRLEKRKRFQPLLVRVLGESDGKAG